MLLHGQFTRLFGPLSYETWIIAAVSVSSRVVHVMGEHLSCSSLNAVCQDFCPVPVVPKGCQNVAFMTSQQVGS